MSSVNVSSGLQFDNSVKHEILKQVRNGAAVGVF